MKTLFSIGALLLTINHLVAQNNLSGKVSDISNHPLPGATLFFPDLGKGTVTNSDGNYSINNLPNGKQKVQISYLGYSNEIKTLFFTGSAQELNVTMHQSPVEAEEIVVTGGYNSTQHENAVKVEVLKLNDEHLLPSPNFTEMLTRIPGVDMISKGNGIGKPLIRGLSLNDILILNNGVRFENYQYSSHHPLGIDEFGLEDVQVIKGPASLLYGSDAIGGVLNFVKEKPAPIETLQGDYNLQAFSNSQGFANNLGFKGSTKNLSGGIRMGQKSHADYLQGGGDFVANSRFNEQSVKTMAGYSGKTGSFRVYYDFNSQKIGLVEEEAIEQLTRRARKPEIFYQQLNTHLLSLQNKLYLGTLKLDLNAAYQNTGLTHVGEADEREIDMQLATLTYEAKLHLPSDAYSEYIIGVQGMNQENTNRHNAEIILLPNAATNSISAFTLLQRTLFQTLKLQTGIRYDVKSINTEAVGSINTPDFRPSLSKAYNSFSGSVGATWQATQHLLFRTNVASAFRTPNLAELTSNGQHETRYEIGEMNLVPEKSMEADISMHLHKSNLTFDLAGFYNYINDYLFISPTGSYMPDGVPIYKYRQGNSYLFGGETGIHIHPKAHEWLHVMATYSMVIGKQTNGDNLPFIPANKLNVETRALKKQLWKLTDTHLSINWQLVAPQNNAAPAETSTSSYQLLNFTTGGQFSVVNQEIRFVLGVNNIFDRKYVDHLSMLKEVERYNPGRNITVSISLPFGSPHHH
jgi:iron complex outermembrane receptor protein